jgi:hypothetical protein
MTSISQEDFVLREAALPASGTETVSARPAFKPRPLCRLQRIARTGVFLAIDDGAGQMAEATEVAMRRFGICSAALFMALLVVSPSARAATIIDLTAGGSGSSNGAFYEWTDFSATGSGVIDAFLRVQNRGNEQGYNHSLGHNVPWDTKPGIHTHDIQYEDLVLATIGGEDYYKFLLDINESNGHDNEYLQLTSVQIFTRSGAITSTDETLDHLGTKRFDSDLGPDGDTTVDLNYALNPGSGGGDMFLYVPVSLFAGTLPSDYVYFYSAFNNSDAGFEEWAMLQNGGPVNHAPVPEPGTMTLLATGLMFAARKWRQQRA